MEEVIICRTRENDEKFEFRVSLLDNTDRTVHDVSLSHEDFETFGLRSESPERFVERCFDFLLEGLTKDSIRSEFDIGTMAEYFPDFAEEMRGGMMRHLAQTRHRGLGTHHYQFGHHSGAIVCRRDRYLPNDSSASCSARQSRSRPPTVWRRRHVMLHP